MSQHEHTWLQVMLTVSAAVVAVFLCYAVAHAHDHRHPELDDWYKSLKSGKGPCCGGPNVDATELSDLQWRTKDDTYEVFVDGMWVLVPETAIVKEPNLAKGARVWLYYYDGRPQIRCFMPGMLT